MNGPTSKTVQKRLEEAMACLEYLETERSIRNDPEFGKLLEQRTVSRELLELEMQDAEERITRMCTAAEHALSLLA
jgi:hypothetical protein